MDYVEFDDPELEKVAEAGYYEFADWLSAQRRKAENVVRALYPQLETGVSVQKIQAALDCARYWNNIPDDMAGMYAYQAAKQPAQLARHRVIAAALDISVCEFWLDLHYMADETETP